MLGTDLLASAPVAATVVAPTSAAVDITDPTRLSTAFDDARPDWVINAAAYTAVDRAETERATADAVNGTAPALIGAECARRGVAMVHYGTDYVFSGKATAPYREADPVAPLNAYGRSKSLGEQRLLATSARAMILRTQWLFGRRGKSFPSTMWHRARAGTATRVVNDQFGRPTYTVDLAAATWRLMEQGAVGTINVTNDGAPATWFDVARHIFARVGAESLLSPCTTAEYPTPARRPGYSVLDTGRLEQLLPRALPDWRNALDRFIDDLSASALTPRNDH
jgi:dTDP-4-dehydrorhamnose reductase